MRKGTKRLTVLLIVFLVVILLAAAVLFMLNRNEKSPGLEATDVEDLILETHITQLRFPGKWGEQVRTVHNDDGETCCNTFYAVTDSGEAKLFDLVIGDADGIYIGSVKKDDGQLAEVYLTMHELENENQWSEKDTFAFYAMQEEINYVIASLPLEEQQEAKFGYLEEHSSNDSFAQYEDLQIDTPYVQLNYPGIWEAHLRVEHMDSDDYCVAFYGKTAGIQEQRLFDVYFRRNGEGGLGFLETTTGEKVGVDLVFYSIEKKKEWTQDQVDLLFSMQDDANYLLSSLKLEKAAPKEEPVTEPVTVDTTASAVPVYTPYLILEFDQKWKDLMYTEVKQEESYTVSFIAAVPGKESMPLFDVVFGDAGERPIGTYMRPNGTEIALSLTTHALDFQGAWTSEEKNLVYEMAEQVNYILDKLQTQSGITLLF